MMSDGIRTLGDHLLIDDYIRGVLRGHRWVTLPPKEWRFLLRIAGKNWVRGKTTAADRQAAARLRQKIGAAYVQCVRGHGYRLGPGR